jgi:hypothetical protein
MFNEQLDKCVELQPNAIRTVDGALTRFISLLVIYAGYLEVIEIQHCHCGESAQPLASWQISSSDAEIAELTVSSFNIRRLIKQTDLTK